MANRAETPSPRLPSILMDDMILYDPTNRMSTSVPMKFTTLVDDPLLTFTPSLQPVPWRLPLPPSILDLMPPANDEARVGSRTLSPLVRHGLKEIAEAAHAMMLGAGVYQWLESDGKRCELPFTDAAGFKPVALLVHEPQDAYLRGSVRVVFGHAYVDAAACDASGFPYINALRLHNVTIGIVLMINIAPGGRGVVQRRLKAPDQVPDFDGLAKHGGMLLTLTAMGVRRCNESPKFVDRSGVMFTASSISQTFDASPIGACSTCMTPFGTLRTCSGCSRAAQYCGKACQKKGYKLHKALCGNKDAITLLMPLRKYTRFDDNGCLVE